MAHFSDAGHHDDLTSLGAVGALRALRPPFALPVLRLGWVQHELARNGVDSALVRTFRGLRMLAVKLAVDALHRVHHVEVRVLAPFPHVAQGLARGRDASPPVCFGRHARTGVRGILGDLARFPPVGFRGCPRPGTPPGSFSNSRASARSRWCQVHVTSRPASPA